MRSDATIREIVQSMIDASESPVFIDDLVSGVVQLRGEEVREASVRSEVSMMASGEAPTIERIRRGWYTSRSAIDPAEEVERVTSSLKALIDDAAGFIEEPRRYRSSALAIVDAVFSTRAHANSVRNVVDRVRSETGRGDSRAFTISMLLEIIEDRAPGAPGSTERNHGLAEFFGNQSKAPGTRGLKGELVVDLGKRLLRFHDEELGLEFCFDSSADFLWVNSLSSSARRNLLDVVEADLTDSGTGVTGIGVVTLRNLFVMMGVDVGRYDRRLVLWCQGALGGLVAPPSPMKAAHLLESAVHQLHSEGCPYSLRAIEQLIWKVQGGRLPELSHHQLGPDVKSGIATRKAIKDERPTGFEPGVEVDRSPRHARKDGIEKWHGRVVDVLRSGRVLVEWSESNSRREFRPGSRIPLREPGDETASIIPFQETVSISNLIICDKSTLNERHPDVPPSREFKIGDKVTRTNAGDATWLGHIVGLDGARNDRFIVHWETITAGPTEHGNAPISREEFAQVFRVENATGIALTEEDLERSRAMSLGGLAEHLSRAEIESFDAHEREGMRQFLEQVADKRDDESASKDQDERVS